MQIWASFVSLHTLHPHKLRAESDFHLCDVNQGWRAFPNPQREGGAPRSRALRIWSWLCNTTTITDARTASRTFLSVWPRPHSGDSACHCGEISKTQRQRVQRTQSSILIPMAFTLPGQLTLRTDVLATPSERIPNTAASKELHKGNSKVICMQGTGHPPSCPLTQAKCVLRHSPL